MAKTVAELYFEGKRGLSRPLLPKRLNLENMPKTPLISMDDDELIADDYANEFSQQELQEMIL